MKRVDVKFIDDAELDTLAFIDAEVRRLGISGGRAGYLLQIATAAKLAARGDAGMYQTFGTGSAPPPLPHSPSARPANDDAIDKMTGDMFT